ncbi:hypothetical protein ACS0TY_004504 [Phlomoides rotata]
MCSIEKRDGIYILTINGDNEHRLDPSLIDSIRGALEQVKSSSSAGSCPTALITTAEGRYFSIGYHQLAQPKVLSEKLCLLVADLISLPMPTIAAVNGNAYGAGLILALSHDYVHMSMGRGVSG